MADVETDSPSPARTQPLNEARVELLRLVAYLHLRYGNPASALAYLRVISKILPAEPSVSRSLALAALRSGNPKNAIQAAETAIAMSDTEEGMETSHLLLVLSRMRCGEREAASTACETYLSGKNSGYIPQQAA
jgi:hypothetical protein